MSKSDEVSKAAGLAGSWSGTIEFDVPIQIEIRIESGASGLSGMSDFPQHRRTDIPLRELSFENACMRFTTQSFGDYSGQLSDDGLSIVGTFAKEQKSYALTLHAGKNQSKPPTRPQTPKVPFPYDVENVYIDNEAAACRLAGTLTIPAHRKIHALAILITGSGAMDRDESIFGHQPFWVLADYLSRQGYAVLRLDDRGVGESTGDRSTITIADEIDDMSAAVAFLLQRRDLQGLPIGLIGHSMGAAVGIALAARCSKIAFMISMAGPGLTLGEAFADRECAALAKLGKSPIAISNHEKFTRALYQELHDRNFDDSIDAEQIRKIVARYDAAETAIVQNSEEWIARFNQAWFRSAIRMNPA